MTPELARILADYNSRMNRKLYAAAATLPDAERKTERGAFFGSIHRTLNHLLWGDSVWLARFEGLPEFGGGTSTELETDFDTLCQRRTEVDARIERYAQALTAERLAAVLIWTNFKGITRTAPLFVLVAHLFNHQTHHRGQVSTLLFQQGVDLGVTDLPVVITE